jgi:hypothetical protein
MACSIMARNIHGTKTKDQLNIFAEQHINFFGLFLDVLGKHAPITPSPQSLD